MRTRLVVIATLAAVSAATAPAQEIYHWPVGATPSGSNVPTAFPMGTPLLLRTRTEANSKQMKPGDRVQLEVAEALTFRGQVIVPSGAPAVAEVSRSERNGSLGKKGQIELRLLQVQTPSGPIRLNGGTQAQGTNATAWSVAGAALIAWPFVFLHGTSGYVRAGTPITGYLAEPLAFAAVAAPPRTALAAIEVRPDERRPLPVRFDPSVFGGRGPSFSDH